MIGILDLFLRCQLDRLFKPRNDSLNGAVLINTTPFSTFEPRGFDAVKSDNLSETVY